MLFWGRRPVPPTGAGLWPITTCVQRDQEDTSRMQREELRLVWQTNQVLLRARYYRGRVYLPRDRWESG